jgi:RimJ/RimL family protein N-acetyltransferase
MDYLFAPETPFETPHFTLRGYQVDDGPLLTEAVIPSYEHLKPWMPWAVSEQSPDEARKLVRTIRGRWLLAQDFTVAIVSPDGSRLLGGCGFHLRHGGLGTRTAEMGMWIRASEAGQGQGTRAVQALMTWGFTAWPWERLIWRCDSRNLGSARVAEKAGLRLEGTLIANEVAVDGTRRDTLCFALLKSEWEANCGANAFG